MDSMHDILKRSRRTPVKRAQQEVVIKKNWEKLVHHDVYRNTFPARICERQLHVIASSAVWAHQLTFFETELVERINQMLERKEVTAIRFIPMDRSSVTKERHEFIMAAGEKNTASRRELGKPMETKTAAASTEDNADQLWRKVDGLQARSKRYWEEQTQVGWRLCAVCGGYYRAECLTCANNDRHRDTRRLHHLLEQTPWISFQLAKRQIQALKESQFRSKKLDMERGFLAEIQSMHTALSSKKKRLPVPAGYIQKLRTTILGYVALKSGRSPDQITPEKACEIIGKKYYNLYDLALAPQYRRNRKET